MLLASDQWRIILCNVKRLTKVLKKVNDLLKKFAVIILHFRMNNPRADHVQLSGNCALPL